MIGWPKHILHRAYPSRFKRGPCSSNPCTFPLILQRSQSLHITPLLSGVFVSTDILQPPPPRSEHRPPDSQCCVHSASHFCGTLFELPLFEGLCGIRSTISNSQGQHIASHLGSGAW